MATAQLFAAAERSTRPNPARARVPRERRGWLADRPFIAVLESRRRNLNWAPVNSATSVLRTRLAGGGSCRLAEVELLRLVPISRSNRGLPRHPAERGEAGLTLARVARLGRKWSGSFILPPHPRNYNRRVPQAVAEAKSHIVAQRSKR